MLFTNVNVRPAAAVNRMVFTGVQVFLGSILIALSAQISIPVPYTPVPVTLQTLAVMMIAVCLGSRKGTLCVLAYLAESMMGFPVLHGGLANPLALIGPNGGYLAGYILQAFLIGQLAERRHTFGKPLALAGIAFVCALQLAIGSLWIGYFAGYQMAFALGFAPFICGEMLKVLIVAQYMYRHEPDTYSG